jgi:Homing endonuclease associated repeat
MRGSEPMSAAGDEPAQSRPLTAVELLGVAFAALSAEEQDQTSACLVQLRLERLAESETRHQSLLASLARAAAIAGPDLTIERYKAARLALGKEGVAIAEVNRLIRFYGSWTAACKALEFSAGMTPSAVATRLKKRRLGKVWRYSEEALGAALAEAVAALGHVPLVAEFNWWRRGALDRATRLGEEGLHLPSATPYRRRYGGWEPALLHFGYTPDQVTERLERGGRKSGDSGKR